MRIPPSLRTSGFRNSLFDAPRQKSVCLELRLLGGRLGGQRLQSGPMNDSCKLAEAPLVGMSFKFNVGGSSFLWAAAPLRKHVHPLVPTSYQSAQACAHFRPSPGRVLRLRAVAETVETSSLFQTTRPGTGDTASNPGGGEVPNVTHSGHS